MQNSGWLNLFRDDVKAKAEWLYGASDGRNCLKALATDGTLAMLLYRLMQSCQHHRLGPLAMIFNKMNGIFGSCIIGRAAECGPRFVLVHSHGVVINGSVRGGRNVMIEHQVTIGAEQLKAPVLGDDIFVGAGAKIIGGVRVGSAVRIGANAVVVKDVPDGATAVGVPARYIFRAGDERSSE